MGQLMLNIPDEILIPFKKLHYGQMSKLISEYMRKYMQINLSSEKKIEQRKLLLDKKKKELAELAGIVQREEHAIKSIEDQQVLQEENIAQEDASIREIVSDIISFTKSQGKFTELLLEAEKAGYDEVSDYLYNKHKEAKKNEKYN